MNIANFLIASVIFCSCSNGDNKPQPDTMRIDSVRIDKLDTIYRYNAQGSVSIEFRKNDTLVHRKLFAANSDTFYYPNGVISHLVVGPSADFDSHHYDYYTNGKLRESYQVGSPFGCGNLVGEKLEFDSTGKLVRSTEFDHFLRDPKDGCHQTVTVMSIKEYSNNNLKATKQLQTTYEGAMDCPCGQWEYFDENGERIKTENFPDCKGEINCDTAR